MCPRSAFPCCRGCVPLVDCPLAIRSSYNSCWVSSLTERLERKEKKKNRVWDLFSELPLEEERARTELVGFQRRRARTEGLWWSSLRLGHRRNESGFCKKRAPGLPETASARRRDNPSTDPEDGKDSRFHDSENKKKT